MFIAGLGEFLTRLRAGPANWIRVLGAPLQKLRRQRRDPRTIPRSHNHRSHRVYVGLGQPSRHQPLTAPPRYVTGIDCITEFWRPHSFSPSKVSCLAVEKNSFFDASYLIP